MSKQASKDEGPKRKGGYPYNIIRQCLRVAEAVKNHGGERTAVPKAVIARELEMDQGSSSFAQLVTSAKTFGMVDGMSELHLSDAGRRYFFPTTDTESRMAELSFFVQPGAFAMLVDELDGSRLPSTPMLANLLGRKWGIPESWRLRAAQIFVSAATDLGVVDQGGSLRYSAAKHLVGAANPIATATPAARPIGPATGGDERRVGDGAAMPDVAPDRLGAIGIVTTGRQYVFADGKGRLETPYPLSFDEWESLKSYVENVLKPKDQGGGT